ncbi:hypothetical protein RMSM_04888 [Rhodopirellula maiorica SM1]|uniref:Uncharacterized protein n=1 Tax=Rhodopirellula maiorica SM1 TaxID=1265738 RepID=M5RS41_9BACT|nr:hypothetical protein [Rhodopirellula maiorica]EMI18197.1 hypothetical protein RMSM_04888 [Rhodopirellula maiorica SM1]
MNQFNRSASTPPPPASQNEAMPTAGNLPAKHRWTRFGLLELLLLTTVVAAWLPILFARRHIPLLESKITSLRAATTQLVILDDQQLNIRSLPGIWHDINSWRYNVPEDARLELRFATESIHKASFPAEYQAVALPTGQHVIHLKCIEDVSGHHSKVFIDDDLVLQQHHPKDWVKSYGSSSTGDVATESTAHPLDEPLKLKVQRYSLKHPLKKYGSVDIPDEYDSKGNCLWISPADQTPPPSPVFYTPQERHGYEGTGGRQGIKVLRAHRTNLVGLIGIVPSLSSTYGDERRGYPYCPLGISVRPILASEGAAAEIPEAQANLSDGIPVSLRESIVAPKQYDESFSHELITENAIQQDGKTMRIFAHFKAFPSGAKPIVEIIFDAAHPDRVGFLPHSAPDSPAMKACQLVTRFDAKFHWREIEMVPDPQSVTDTSSKPLRQPLSAFYPDIDFAKLAGGSGSVNEPFGWREISVTRLPQVAVPGSQRKMTRLNLTTDVADATKLNYPLGLSRNWQYEGIPNRQVWWLPTADESDESDENGITVEIQGGAEFPQTMLAIPGGPVIQNVRITVPMPAKEPVWLEIAAESEAN